MAESPPGSRSLLRTGGIALLGVGVIAATAGLFTSVTNGHGSGTVVPSASSASAAPVAPTAAPPTAPVVTTPAPTVLAAPPPTASAAPAPTTQPAPQTAAPSAPAPAPRPAPTTGGAPGARAPLRVYNNSLIQGLAAQAKSDFEAKGWTVTSIAGFPGTVAHSTAYFRPGTGEEAAAQELGREFGLHVEPRFAGLDEATPGVIVIVTQDYRAAGR